MTDNLFARPFGNLGDYQIINGWWLAHSGQPLLETILPPLGVVVEDASGPVAAGWAYQATGIGVAFFEFPATRPGLGLAAARRAMGYLVAALHAALKATGYSVLLAYARPPAARALERFYGFSSDGARELMVSKID